MCPSIPPNSPCRNHQGLCLRPTQRSSSVAAPPSLTTRLYSEVRYGREIAKPEFSCLAVGDVMPRTEVDGITHLGKTVVYSEHR